MSEKLIRLQVARNKPARSYAKGISIGNNADNYMYERTRQLRLMFFKDLLGFLN